MSFITAAVIGGGAALAAGYMGSQAAAGAAQTQAQAGVQAAQLSLEGQQQAIAAQQAMYQQNLANQQPYMAQGAGAIGQLGNLMGTSGNTGAAGYGSLAQPFNASQLALTQNPSYQFQLQQGMQALQGSAAASGGLLTGQGAKNIANYSQGLASTNYQNAFQNYQTQQTNLYNRLSGVAGLGQAAAAGVGGVGAQLGTGIANTTMAGTGAQTGYLTGSAASQAAGQIGAANAWGGALTGAAGNYGMWSVLGSQSPSPSQTQVPQINPYAQQQTFGQPSNIYQGLTGNYNLIPTQ